MQLKFYDVITRSEPLIIDRSFFFYLVQTTTSNNYRLDGLAKEAFADIKLPYDPHTRAINCWLVDRTSLMSAKASRLFVDGRLSHNVLTMEEVQELFPTVLIHPPVLFQNLSSQLLDCVDDLFSKDDHAQIQGAHALVRFAERQRPNSELMSQYGFIHQLIMLLKSDNIYVIGSALCALSYLVKDNRVNQAIIRQSMAISVLLTLLTLDNDYIKKHGSRCLRYMLQEGDVLNCKVIMSNAMGIKPLADLLKHSDLEIKKHALLALAGLLAFANEKGAINREKQAYIKDIIPSLVTFLKVEDDEILKAVLILMYWGTFCNKFISEDIVREGAVVSLIELLSHPDEIIKEEAVKIFGNLVDDFPDISDLVRHNGGIQPLIDSLNYSGISETFVKNVAWALASLAEVNRVNSDEIQKRGGIKALLLHCECKDVDRLIAVTWALTHLASDNIANCNAIRESGGIQKLLNLLEVDEEAVQANTLEILIWLVKNSDSDNETIEVASRIKDLIHLFNKEELVKEKATELLAILVKSSVQNRDIVRQSGGIHGLIAVLKSNEDEQICSNATLALCRLVIDNPESFHLIQTSSKIHDTLRRMLRSSNVLIQTEALEALTYLLNESAVSDVQEMLSIYKMPLQELAEQSNHPGLK